MNSPRINQIRKLIKRYEDELSRAIQRSASYSELNQIKKNIKMSESLLKFAIMNERKYQ